MSSETAKPVVVGIGSGGHDYLHALAFAVSEADRRHAPLRLVHGRAPLTMAPLFRAMSPADEHHREALHALEVAAGRSRRFTKGSLVVETVLSSTTGAEALIAESRHACLLVVQRRDVSSLTRWTSGSTTERVLAHGACPVAILRADVPVQGTGSGVVVGVPDDDGAQPALAVAFEEARLRGTGLTVVRAFGGSLKTLPTEESDDSDESGQGRERALGDLLEGLAPFTAQFPDVTVATVVVPEPVSLGLRRAAEGAELLVLGPEESPGSPQRLGRVARECLKFAECPIIITGLPA